MLNHRLKISYIVFFNCMTSINSFAQEKEFNWLIGSWKIEGKNEFEVWKREGGTPNLKGKAFRVNGTDTVVTELISLTYYDQSFHYIPDVAGAQSPVDFKITTFDEKGFLAENPLHDFPKKIRYKWVIKNEGEFIEAAIEGNGKVIPYNFRKLK